MKKRILMSDGVSVLMVVLGIINAFLFYDVGKNEYDSFAQALSDPLGIILILICISPFACACMHFVVTDEGIKNVTKGIIRFEDITEIGVNYGGPYAKNYEPKVTYIRYNTT